MPGEVSVSGPSAASLRGEASKLKRVAKTEGTSSSQAEARVAQDQADQARFEEKAAERRSGGIDVTA